MIGVNESLEKKKDFKATYENKNNYKTKLFMWTIYIVEVLCIIITLPVTVSITLFFAFIVSLESKGGAFYSQVRLGKNGRNFKIYKLRSMYIDAEKHGPQWALTNDNRITRTGYFIRKTRIDELPQLVNVLKGDMSLIGPRPERPEFVSIFEKDIPNFTDRLLVKPGLTGWAQVNGGYELTPTEKLEYDLFYIENQSISLNFRILLKTFKIVITGHGAR